MNIEDLPDFPALQQIGRALWKQGKTRGAAVLVGAGFSRNAEAIHDGAILPPLWSDLAHAMEDRIGPISDRFRDPLRTAEEFRAVLGQPALEGLIRELVPDDQWLPGELHKKLVALPWVDILTTNWDTLLERAATTTLGQNFETVHCMEDIATTRSPRVVKLHGSLPSNRPFILSEDDYRTYPQRFAPFVNLVQQVLLENELCLLGFSGDDPNFLKWSGWIRDQLGISARRIYLVGALRLGTAQRRLLEQRNISPIDLTPLVNHLDPADRHKAATALFLNRLYADRPKAMWEWNLHRSSSSVTPDFRAEPVQIAVALKALAEGWEAARLSYPGWAVCPAILRNELKLDSVHALQNPRALASMSQQDLANICFETVWRLDAALLPIGTWATTLAASAGESSCWEDAKKRDFVMMLLLRNAREDRDTFSFEKWAAELAQRAASNPQIAPTVIYERCLWARDGLDFNELTKLAPTLSGTDPVWGLRRAALHSYLGDFSTARVLIEKVLAETRDLFSRDRNSIWALSRLAWAQFCAGPLRDWNEPDTNDEDKTALKLRLHETKCEPWDTLTDLDNEIEESLRRHAEASRTIEPQFEPGTYRDHSSTLRFGNSPGLVNYVMDRLSDSVGLPLRTRNTVVLGSRMEKAEPLIVYGSDADYLRLLRIIQADQPAAMERHFGRIQVANLPMESVVFLKQVLSGALDYALTQVAKKEGWTDQFWSTRAGLYTEVLSRLLVRSDSAEALEWLRKSLAFGRDPRWHHPELFEPLAHMIERAISAIPTGDRTTLLIEVMEFPLPGEVPLPIHLEGHWPNSSEWIGMPLMKRLDTDDRLKRRIISLIEMTRTGSIETRQRAAFWLMQLQISGVLTPEEGKDFGEALWSRRPSEVEFPSDTNLRSHMFLLLPSPDPQKTRDLFKQLNHEDLSAAYLISVSGATHARPDGSRYELYDRTEALSMLEKIVDWRPEPAPRFDFGQVAAENEKGVQSIGGAIANAILPVLQPGELPPELAERIFARENDSLSVVQAYPEVVRLLPSEADRAVKGIIRAIVNRKNGVAWAGFNALYRWFRSVQNGSIPALPRRLIEATLSVIETRREPGLIHALNMAGHFLHGGLLSADDKDRLANALGLVYVETLYDTAEDERIIGDTTWTLVRAKAARLAGALREDGVEHSELDEWLNNAPNDPMPEVRFAIGSPFE
ncbi:MAG: SIR2 family protein [Acidobacteriaceae bacterium]